MNLVKYPDGGRHPVAYRFMSDNGIMLYIFKGSMHLTDERHETKLWYFSTWEGFQDSVGQNPSHTSEEAERKAEAMYAHLKSVPNDPHQ